MTSRLLTASLIAAAAGMVSAQAAQADCPVAGKYRVVGRVPGAVGSYQGKAFISKSETGGCLMMWGDPNSSKGAGEFADGVLTINFTVEGSGRKGVVKYTRAPNGDLHGVWWYNKAPNEWGTESLLH